MSPTWQALIESSSLKKLITAGRTSATRPGPAGHSPRVKWAVKKPTIGWWENVKETMGHYGKIWETMGNYGKMSRKPLDMVVKELFSVDVVFKPSIDIHKGNGRRSKKWSILTQNISKNWNIGLRWPNSNLSVEDCRTPKGLCGS